MKIMKTAFAAVIMVMMIVSMSMTALAYKDTDNVEGMTREEVKEATWQVWVIPVQGNTSIDNTETPYYCYYRVVYDAFFSDDYEYEEWDEIEDILDDFEDYLDEKSDFNYEKITDNGDGTFTLENYETDEVFTLKLNDTATQWYKINDLGKTVDTYPVFSKTISNLDNDADEDDDTASDAESSSGNRVTGTDSSETNSAGDVDADVTDIELDENETDTITTANDSDEESNNEDNKNNVLFYVLVALIAAGIIVIIVLVIKRKKDSK